jgi:Uncharacterized conserved protein
MFHFFSGENQTIQSVLYYNVFMPVVGGKFASLIYALLFVGINWGIGHILYKKKIYIKL